MKLSKSLAVFLIAVSLTGCGRFDRWWAGQTGNAVEECHDGVTYLQFTSGASVAYNKNGTIKTCS
jgi:hypothetical protein